MDGSRFDRLARLTADSQSRRGVVRLAFAGALGAGSLLAHEAAAKKKCKKKKGKKRCDGVCVRIVDDPNNCGDCGIQCGVNEDCIDGVCFNSNPTCADGAPCPDPTPDCCGDTCVDTLGDPDNCGGCGNICDDGQTCEAGLCSGGGGGDQCSGPTGICNADPTPCGTSATGETCGCERSVEETNFCADGANPCPVVKECTSTDGGEPTSCEQMLGFHFFCQKAKTNAQGQFCGCGFGTQTGQVCVAECDKINPAAAKHRQKRRHGRTNAKAHAK